MSDFGCILITAAELAACDGSSQSRHFKDYSFAVTHCAKEIKKAITPLVNSSKPTFSLQRSDRWIIQMVERWKVFFVDSVQCVLVGDCCFIETQLFKNDIFILSTWYLFKSCCILYCRRALQGLKEQKSWSNPQQWKNPEWVTIQTKMQCRHIVWVLYRSVWSLLTLSCVIQSNPCSAFSWTWGEPFMV